MSNDRFGCVLMMKKILGITTIRSDYDLMSKLYKILNKDNDIEFKLLVGGTHLSTTYGNTVNLIEKDGLDILLKIETLIDSNSSQSRLKSASLLLQNSIDIVAQWKPNLIMYAGDREDVIIGALLGAYLQIPTIHFFGGDHVKDGHVDNPIRHATSKLSTIHMVSIEQHKERLIRMGELEERIYVIGSIALDKFAEHKLISKEKIKEIFNIKKYFNNFALVIFHSQDIEKEYSHIYFENILLSLKKNNINAFVSYPNTDPGNKNIIDVIKKYENDNNFIFYKSLERNLFLSMYKNSMFLIGNSSSGVMEAASIPIPVINVGLRQRERLCNQNVIFCDTDIVSINNAINKAISDEFRKKISYIKNIYGDGKSSEKAYKIIKKIIKGNYLQKLLYKKEDILEII